MKRLGKALLYSLAIYGGKSLVEDLYFEHKQDIIDWMKEFIKKHDSNQFGCVTTPAIIKVETQDTTIEKLKDNLKKVF